MTSLAPLRHDWTLAEIETIYTAPLPDLIFRAKIQRRYHRADQVQGRAAQHQDRRCPTAPIGAIGALFDRRGARDPVSRRDERGPHAPRIRARFCMAPRGGRGRSPAFDESSRCASSAARNGSVLHLGMLTDDQAAALGAAGLTAYNHNRHVARVLRQIITTRTHADRLRDAARVRRRGHRLLRRHHRHGRGSDSAHAWQLGALDPHPESVPVNLLVRVA